MNVVGNFRKNFQCKISQNSVQRVDVLRDKITDWRTDVTTLNNCSSQLFCEIPTNKVVLCRHEGLDVQFWKNFTEKHSWKLKPSNILEDLKLQQLHCELLKSQNVSQNLAFNYYTSIGRSTLQTPGIRHAQGVKTYLTVFFV